MQIIISSPQSIILKSNSSINYLIGPLKSLYSTTWIPNWSVNLSIKVANYVKALWSLISSSYNTIYQILWRRPTISQPGPIYFDSTPFNTALNQERSKLNNNQFNLIIEIGTAALEYKNPRAIFNELVNQFNGSVWNSTIITLIQNTLSKHLPTQKIYTGHSISEIASSGLVCFYKNGPTAIFGNFALCPKGVTVFGKSFRCAEAAFQWKKFQLAGVPEDQLTKFFTSTGEEAFQLSRSIHIDIPLSWYLALKSGPSSDRFSVMRKALKAKFNQNPEMMNALKDTGAAYLLEHNPVIGRDNYWSDDHTGDGKNRLGKLLMSIRNTNQTNFFPVKHYSNIALAGLPYQIN
jgi:ribA/ribD-fused uncharacterized protein